MDMSTFSLPLILFCFLSIKLVVASFGVILARNPIHAVLCLIVAFLDAAVLFILNHAEFLGFILAIVYVGAVAILFLFAVIMFPLSFHVKKSEDSSFSLWASGIGLLFFAELGTLMFVWKTHPKASHIISAAMPKHMSDVEALGHLLYTDYLLPFQVAGLLLLVAMIGAIALTLRTKNSLKKQNIKNQMERTPQDTLFMASPSSHKGLKDSVSLSQKEPLS